MSYSAVKFRGISFGAAECCGELLAAESHVHSSVSFLIFRVHIGSLYHQKLHQLHVPLSHCKMQRCLATIIADVDITATLEL